MKQQELNSEALTVATKIGNAEEGIQYFAEPFQHVVIDDIFSSTLATDCLANFPSLTDDCWEFSNEHEIEVKARTTWSSEFEIPAKIIDAVRILNSAPVLRAMSSRFKIPKLMPDPYFTGGGLNCTPSGGLLDIHVDGNYHDATGMHRRMNALVYLNPDWQESWGGEFGIYAEDGETLVKVVPPVHNRLVLFDTHDKSFHGLPNPIQFPPDNPRRSIILYYYTVATRPEELVTSSAPHSALWKKRNFNDKHGNKSRPAT